MIIPIKDILLENSLTDIFSYIKKLFSTDISEKEIKDVKISKNEIKHESDEVYVKNLKENDAELAYEFLKALGTKLNLNNIKDIIKSSLCLLLIEEINKVTYITGFLALQKINEDNLYLVSYSVVPNSDKNAIKILKNLQKNGFKISTGVGNKEQFDKFINLGFKKANKSIPDLEALLILENENIPLGKKIGYTTLGLGGGMIAGGYLGNVAGGIADGIDIGLDNPNYSSSQIESLINRRVANGDAYLLDGLKYGTAIGGISGGLYAYNKASKPKQN